MIGQVNLGITANLLLSIRVTAKRCAMSSLRVGIVLHLVTFKSVNFHPNFRASEVFLGIGFGTAPSTIQVCGITRPSLRRRSVHIADSIASRCTHARVIRSTGQAPEFRE